MVEVYINDIKLDSPNGQISQTFQNNDVGELSNRQTSFTNRFKAPKTPKNIKALRMLSIPGNGSRIPYKNNTGRIVENGIEILSKGYTVVQDADPNYYSIIIYGAEKNLFEQLKSYTLQDAFPNLNLRYTAESVGRLLHSKSNIIFTLLHYNNFTKSNDSLGGNQNGVRFTSFTELYTTRITPQFYVKDLWRHTFDFLGYRVIHPLDSLPLWEEMLMAASKGVSNFNLNYGDIFNLKNVAPVMSLSDFVKEIMQRYGLVVRVNETTKTVTFKRIEDILTSPVQNSTDWSDKFESVKDEKYKFGNYGQLNYLNYSGDDDGAPDLNDNLQGFGFANEMRGVFSINNVNLTSVKDVIQSKITKPNYASQKGASVFTNDFKWGSIRVGVDTNSSQDKIFTYFLLYLNEYKTNNFTQEFERIESYVEEFKPQFFYRKKVSFPYRYKLTRARITDFYSTTKSFAYVASYEELNYQAFIDEHYPAFIEMLQKMTLVRVWMNFNVVDTYNLNFLRKVYIKQLGSEFYINKVKNYKSGKLTEVELIKVPVGLNVSNYESRADIIGKLI